jgi:hypothetical protein
MTTGNPHGIWEGSGVSFLVRIANDWEATMGMLNKTQVALALLLVSSQTLAERPPRPASVFASSQTIAVTPTRPSSTNESDQAPAMIRVATIVDRIEHDRQDIRVYEASRPLDLPWYSEMVIAVPRDRHSPLDSLQGSSVGLVQDEKPMGEWALYSNVVGMGDSGLSLADNVFRVRKVIVCTSRHAIELRMGGWVYRVKPGQVLLVLG